jgi:hypothetical protein
VASTLLDGSWPADPDLRPSALRRTLSAEEGAMDGRSADVEAIVAAATDYVEGWFDGDAGRMASCLHPALAKRSAMDPSGGKVELDEAPYRDMVEATGRRARAASGRDYELVVLDVFDGIATAKILSEPYMDYLHLARFGDRWLIVNVLYVDR